MNVKRILVIVMILLLCMPTFVYAAAENLIVKEYPFESDTKDFSYTAQKNIEESGVKYELKDTKYEIINAPTELKRVKTYTQLTEKKVPQTLKLKSGETLQLSDIVWSEQTRAAATGTLTITGSDSRPDAPATKDITATLPDGSNITVTGKLQRVEKTGESYSKPFTVNATFTGDEDVDTYMLGDAAIPNNPDSPAFSGYETAVLTYLGLDPDKYKITSAKWTSGYTQLDNGTTVRYAQYSGQQLTSDWTAYYAETIGADSPQVTTYTAKATYTSTDDKYEVLAICTYEKAHNLLPVIIGIGIGVCILALVIVVILQILKKKKGDENENSN